MILKFCLIEVCHGMEEYIFVYNTSTITALMAMSNTNCQKVLFILNYNTNCIKRYCQGNYNSGHNRIEKINVAPVRYHVDCIVLGHIVLLMVKWIFSSFYIFLRIFWWQVKQYFSVCFTFFCSDFLIKGKQRWMIFQCYPSKWGFITNQGKTHSFGILSVKFNHL